MANYTSHAIMANEVYKQLKDINKIEINNDYLNFFSMGQDFTFTDSNLFDETHNLYSKAFFINTIKYIKENKSIRDGLFLYNVNTIDNDTGIFSIR